jgi:hypothetical protein
MLREESQALLSVVRSSKSLLPFLHSQQTVLTISCSLSGAILIELEGSSEISASKI